MATDPATITTVRAFLLALKKDRNYRRTYNLDPVTTVNQTGMSQPKKNVVLTGSEAQVDAELATEGSQLTSDISIQRYIHV